MRYSEDLRVLSNTLESLLYLSEEAANLAEKTRLQVVMNRCPDIELTKPYWITKLDY